MKNCVNTRSKVGYLIECGYGGDIIRCPYCGKMDAFSAFNLNHMDKMPETRDKFALKFEEDDFFKKWFYYCEDCKITFDNGCQYSDPGVADDGIYNAHIISKYMFEGDVYEGTPLFESIDEWLDLCDKVQVLEWRCPNNGAHNFNHRKYDFYEKCEIAKMIEGEDDHKDNSEDDYD